MSRAIAGGFVDGLTPELELALDVELLELWQALEPVRGLLEPELLRVLGDAIRAAYAQGRADAERRAG